MNMILASNSPRRKEILQKLKIPFMVRTSQTSEEVYIGEDPEIYVQRMAEAKAEKVAESFRDALVIGSDTIVCLGGDILGKPSDKKEAFAMLRKISGKSHLVYTAVCMISKAKGQKIAILEKTVVDFAELTDREIQEYIDTEEPMDKAGSYGIQDQGALFVEGITGCFYNVMGLPIRRVYEELQKIE